MNDGLWVACGYLCGSIPFGALIARAVAGKDIQAEGSGNIGATNVARVVGKRWGVLVMVLDALKGALPTWAAQEVASEVEWLHAAVALAAFAGHVFPVWLAFKGGKGVATALGVLAVLTPLPALCGAATYAVLFLALRISSVGSLVGSAVTLAAAFVVDTPTAYRALLAVMVSGIVVAHRGNIARILSRAEKPLP